MLTSIRRLCLAAVAVTTAVALAGPAAAGNPHFIKNATGASLQGVDLLVTFKEAGLPSGSIETIRSSALASTTYECINGGGHNPSASNKTTTDSGVSKTGLFSASRNGTVSGSQLLSPPSASSLGFSCPPGQRVTFVGVTYSNVLVEDLTSGASMAIPGVFTA